MSTAIKDRYTPISEATLERLETVAMDYGAWKNHQNDDEALNVVLDRLLLLEKLMSETYETVANLAKAF